MQAAEIELKFPVNDVDAFEQAIRQLSLRLVTERTLERNTLYDTPARDLRNRRQLLRLREYGARKVITHKRVADGEGADTRYKRRIETESEVEDPAALAEIFTQLGFGPVFRYEKFRTEWDDGEGHLVLDQTPIGTWAELEGPPAWIDRMRETLGVREEDCLLDSYGMLFLNWKERTGSPAENLTFEEIAPEMEMVRS